ncbi:UDP-N-acetylmuramoyl-tripeptide--D-alanyl-D-alanine ligase [Patescibacteria group bacterium]|nr:MAG: UDP-N-acetylmuramoyl-tripeptide--D-alanyl-D-alanine ligase [Patescibacteria group bacterium]
MGNLKELFRQVIVFLLTLEAKLVLRKHRPKIIAVTGSVGKTSAKDAIYTALSKSFFVRRSEKSFNGDIGVPLTVLGVRNGWSNVFQWMRNLVDGISLLVLTTPYPKWLIVEVGADRPGDITKSLSWLKPDVVVATRFPDISVHVEFYASPEDVIKEELAPVGWLQNNGVLVFNEDDERARTAVTAPGVRRLSFGFGENANLKAENLHATSEDGMPSGISFDVSYGDERGVVSIPDVAGRSHVYSVLAGIAVALSVGVSLEEAVSAFQKHETPAGRMRLINGMRTSVIIDDTYNASPAAMEEALIALGDIPRTGRRIAVLADMLELGGFSVTEHNRIGALVAKSADILVTVGVRTKGIAEGARASGMPENVIIECERGSDASTALLSLIQSGDVILVKGSQSMRMERVVKSLMAEPEKAKDLLVRQDAEWSIR